MSFSGDIFSKQNRAGTEAPLFSIANGDLDLASEVHDELTARRVVPIDEVLLAVSIAKDHSFGRDKVRHRRSIAGVFHFRLDILEMGFARRVGINAGVFHTVTSWRSFSPEMRGEVEHERMPLGVARENLNRS